MSYIFLFKKLWEYSKGRRIHVVIFMTLHILSNITPLSNPLIFAQILNTIQLSQADQIIENILPWIFLWVGMSLWFNISHRIGRHYELQVAYKCKQAFVNQHYNLLTELPLSWHNIHHSADSIDRVNLAASSLHDYVSKQFTFIQHFMLFWGSLLGLAILSLEISLVSMTLGFIVIYIIHKFDIRLADAHKKLNVVKHKISSVFHDYVSNIKTIITLRVSKATSIELSNQIDKGFPHFMYSESKLNGWKWFVVLICMTLLRIGVIFYYILSNVYSGTTILIGNISAIFQYLERLSNTFTNIAREYQQLVQWKANFSSINFILDEHKSIGLNSEYTGISDWEKIDICNLNFNHKKGCQTIDDINVSFSKSEKIALVGESGAGKSTFLAILRGLYKTQKVEAVINGNLAKNNFVFINNQTSLLSQEVEIFDNTILYNITLGIDYAPKDIETALNLARFNNVLSKLPMGLETKINERGAILSGGERQRLALARGILASQNSAIILIDEPTSSLDQTNEDLIFKNIIQHFFDRTIIASVHKLSVLKYFDRVLVMKHGRIVEDIQIEDVSDELLEKISTILDEDKLAH